MAVTISGSGQIIKQVIQTVSSTLQVVSGTSFVELSSLNTAIIPTNSANKILVQISITFGGPNDLFPAFKLFRGATWIGQSAASGPAQQTTFAVSTSYGGAGATVNNGLATFTYLDSPSTTSATTYSVQVSPKRTASNNFSLNKADTINDANQCTGLSTMTLYEVAYA
jgi:hypothetical protein